MARRDTNGHANGSGGAASGRSVPNTAFARTSFLDGGNAAYVEQLQESLSTRSGFARPVLARIFRRNSTTTAPRSRNRREGLAGKQREQAAARTATS